MRISFLHFALSLYDASRQLTHLCDLRINPAMDAGLNPLSNNKTANMLRASTVSASLSLDRILSYDTSVSSSTNERISAKISDLHMIIQIIYYTFALLHTRLKNKITRSVERHTALNVRTSDLRLVM